MTAEQFFELPEPTGNFTYEPHFGELVKVGRPKKRRFDLQGLIRDIVLQKLGRARWVIDIEMPYGLSADYDVRAADVGVVRRKAWDAIPDEGYLIGSPELVVQVKSRSNRDQRMEADAVMHFTHGASAVLLIKPERREVVVVTAASRTMYGSGETIDLPVPLSISVSTDEICPLIRPNWVVVGSGSGGCLSPRPVLRC
jgi:Uma2 family endonuclease